jgi:signal transduction histidine kinase
VGWLNSTRNRSSRSRRPGAHRPSSKGPFPLFRIAVLSGIALLLVVVGTLQYRWSTQIKRAAEVRMGADLESVMMKWYLDFYGEFSAVCVALQIGPDSGARDNWEDYLNRYSEWIRAAKSSESVENIYSNRDLVKDIYIWETSKRANPRLLRLNPDAGKVESSAVSPDLQVLLALLRNHSSNLRVALRAWELDDAPHEARSGSGDRTAPSQVLRSNAITGWQFDEEIPAIVHPIFHRTHPGAVHNRVSSSVDPVDWVVVVLNLETIQKRILPELKQRYFSGGQGLDYRLAVIVAGTTPRLLYSSDPEFGPREVGVSDSVMNIFGPPPESTEGHLWQTEKNKKSLKGEDWHRFSSPVWFPIIQHTALDGPWMLALQNRKGPLDAAVTKVWRSNLLIGSVVLLLLAASVVLVVIASQRAQALANLQMDFVASVSHELRTPLAAVLSAGQNITDGFVPDLKLYGSIITSQARQLIDLVDQILLFASMKDDKENYFLQPLKVTEVLDQVRKNTVATFEQTGFTVDFHIQESLPRVLGDVRLLSRCLQNLIGNAVKYGEGSRRIDVSAHCGELEGSGKEVRISVKDRGMGISPSELPHIFEPFYRSPRVVAAQIHGTGLGLAVTKHLAEAMGGSVSVVSEVGVGSVFALHLRVAGESDAERAAGVENGVTAR